MPAENRKTLLKKAYASERSGDKESAKLVYLRLAKQFPGSREAETARSNLIELDGTEVEPPTQAQSYEYNKKIFRYTDPFNFFLWSFWFVLF